MRFLFCFSFQQLTGAQIEKFHQQQRSSSVFVCVNVSLATEPRPPTINSPAHSTRAPGGPPASQCAKVKLESVDNRAVVVVVCLGRCREFRIRWSEKERLGLLVYQWRAPVTHSIPSLLYIHTHCWTGTIKFGPTYPVYRSNYLKVTKPAQTQQHRKRSISFDSESKKYV